MPVYEVFDRSIDPEQGVYTLRGLEILMLDLDCDEPSCAPHELELSSRGAGLKGYGDIAKLIELQTCESCGRVGFDQALLEGEDEDCTRYQWADVREVASAFACDECKERDEDERL